MQSAGLGCALYVKSIGLNVARSDVEYYELAHNLQRSMHWNLTDTPSSSSNSPILLRCMGQ